MQDRKRWSLPPVFWSLLILVLAQTFALTAISREDSYLASKNLALPPSPPAEVVLWPQNVTAPTGEVIQVQAYSSFGPILIYFLVAVIAIGSLLFLIPVSKLMLVLRLVFTLLFAWGTFIMLVFWFPFWATLAIAAAMGIAWFFIRRVWLHDLAMLLSMAALGAVFGRLISPWTTMLIIAAIAVYDFLAVRFGYMVWMTEKLSESDNLPAFIIPHSIQGWASNFGRNQVKKLVETKPSERTESILGGGDIGFAVLITCSMYVSRSLSAAIIMAVFTLLGLASAYVIQAVFLKGKAMPALPPIAAFSIIGLLITAGLPSF